VIVRLQRGVQTMSTLEIWAEKLDALVDAVRRNGATKQDRRHPPSPGRQTQACFCLWYGYGGQQVQVLSSRPERVRAENRAYQLLTGPVAAVTDLVPGASQGGANLWWPRDRTWLVATKIDGCNTFVGASHGAIAALLAEPRPRSCRCVRGHTPRAQPMAV